MSAPHFTFNYNFNLGNSSAVSMAKIKYRKNASINHELEVKSSEIHGLGLFARSHIPKGALVGICKTKKAGEEDGPYTLYIENEKKREVTCILKFINHSGKPNVVYYNDLSVVTLKKLKPGDELTHDYGDGWQA